MWFLIVILSIMGFALFIDWRRKKNNNNPHIPTNPNAKPGEDSNYTMGDSNYTNSGG